jgi:hypothetical protein
MFHRVQFHNTVQKELGYAKLLPKIMFSLDRTSSNAGCEEHCRLQLVAPL